MRADTHPERKRIVVLGGGFGGAYCVQELTRRLRPRDAEIVLLDRHNYFVFYPLLVEAGTGGLEPRHTVVPIREFTRGADFRMAEVTAVDLAARIVSFRLTGMDRTEELTFDHLVLALGSVTRTPDIPGLREYGMGLKSLADAVALRDRAIQMLEVANAMDDPVERQRLLHFVTVGGNFTGVEIAGEYYELLRSASRLYARVGANECRMTLLELSDRILAPLGADLSTFALASLRKRGIDVRLRSTVSEVHKGHVVLDSGETLLTRTVIWCAGIAPNPLLTQINVPVDDRGYIRCERDLRVEGRENIWAIGDSAVNRDADGTPYPATAQHAVRQGTHVARNVAAVLKGRGTTPCDLTSMGSLAAIGCRTGVAKVFGIKLSGFPAWFLWRTVYLLKMPRWSRRVRVALDWTINLFFSRDFVQLDVHRRPTDD